RLRTFGLRPMPIFQVHSEHRQKRDRATLLSAKVSRHVEQPSNLRVPPALEEQSRKGPRGEALSGISSSQFPDFRQPSPVHLRRIRPLPAQVIPPDVMHRVPPPAQRSELHQKTGRLYSQPLLEAHKLAQIWETSP